MPQTKIFIELSDEIQQVINSSKISLEDLLKRQMPDVEIIYGKKIYNSDAGFREKGIVPIILAASAGVATISFAISQILHAIYKKPHLVEFYENEILKDNQGNAILDEDGLPILQPVKKYQFIEPRIEDSKKELEFSFGLKNGIVIKIRSEENQMNP